MSKFNSAGEWAEAMIATGNHYSLGTSAESWYDRTRRDNPFRIKRIGAKEEALDYAWNRYNEAVEIKCWKDRLPENPTLCWVWSGNQAKRHGVVIDIKSNGAIMLSDGRFCDDARPMTPEEGKTLIFNERED